MRHLFKDNLQSFPKPSPGRDLEPDSQCGKWQILKRGHKHRYWFERFDSEEDAKKAARLVIDSRSMGAGFVDAEVVTLTASQIAKV